MTAKRHTQTQSWYAVMDASEMNRLRRLLKLRSEQFSDYEKMRIGIHNRQRAILLLGGRETDTLVLQEQSKLMDHIENQERLAMIRIFRLAYPEVRLWAKNTMGVGEKSCARILGAQGDPTQATPSHWEVNPDFDDSKQPSDDNPKRLLVEDEPFARSIGQWWQYNGFGDKRRDAKYDEASGFTAQEWQMRKGNPHAKKIAYMMALGAFKNGSPTYAPIYYASKEKDAHLVESGEMRPLHAHNRALRKVAKEMLRDMYLVQRDGYEAWAASQQAVAA